MVGETGLGDVSVAPRTSVYRGTKDWYSHILLIANDRRQFTCKEKKPCWDT